MLVDCSYLGSVFTEELNKMFVEKDKEKYFDAGAFKRGFTFVAFTSSITLSSLSSSRRIGCCL